MRRIVFPPCASLAAVALLGLAVAQASANQLSLSSRTFRVTWSSLQMTPNGFEPVRCPVTLEGSLHSSTFGKIGGALLGYVTRAVSGTCTGGTVTFLTGTLPWHVRYGSFAGVLPAISSLTLQLVGLSVSGTEFGLTCLYRATETSPARLVMNLAGGTIAEARADERATLLLVSGGFCPSTGAVSGSGRATVAGSSTSIAVTLLGQAGAAPRVVTLGDSFVSGEGGRWAGNVEPGTFGPEVIDALGVRAYFDEPNPQREKIVLCHRSLSWEGGIAINGSPTTLNLACSGARVRTAMSGNDFKPGIDFESTANGRGQALMLREDAELNRNAIRMVVLSIGGNDYGFATIITNCITAFTQSRDCKEEAATQELINNAAVAANTELVTRALREVRRAMFNAGYADNSWRLLVENYPSPIPPAASMRYPNPTDRIGRGGCPFSSEDFDWLNTSVLPVIDGTFLNAVANSGLTNVVLLDVRSAFNGRRLCETGVKTMEENGYLSWRAPGAVNSSEWVTRWLLTAGPYYQQEGFHPNYWGQLALRRCVRLAWNNGAPIGGTCTIDRTGQTNEGEPIMRLNP